MKACEEMTDNKLCAWKYAKQVRSRASKTSVFVLLLESSPAGNNQEPVLPHCYFAVTMYHDVEHCRAKRV